MTPASLSPTKKRFARSLHFKNGEASDQNLARLAEEYLAANGLPFAPINLQRMWLAIEADEHDVWKCIGILHAQNVIDISGFHVDGAIARDLLIGRFTAWMDEAGMNGAPVFIFVEPERERFWLKFLRRIRAKKANRWTAHSRVDLLSS